MVKRRAYFIEASAVIRKGESYVRLLVKGKTVIRLYYKYDPYFYVDAPSDKTEAVAKTVTRAKNGETVTVAHIEEVNKVVFGKERKLLKVYCKKPQHVPVLKAAIPWQCFEYNIPFFRRFMFDLHITPFSILEYEREGHVITKIISISPGEPKLTKLAFDIETYNPQGAPRDKQDPAVMISYDDGNKNSGVITFKPVNRDFVKVVKDEKEMIEEFAAIVRRVDPDILYGYNSANFDIPYLMTRAQVLKIPFKLGRGKGIIREIKRGMINGMELESRIHMDLYPLVRFFSFIGVIKAQRYTLDAVAEEVLGKKKHKFNRMKIWESWDKGELDDVADYSLTDSKLTFELGEMLLPLQVELATITKMTLFDVSLSTSGQLVEALLMYNSNLRNEVIPNRPSEAAIRERMANPIQGAFVKLPAPGVYEKIAVLDFRGLYPSIIISYNIDPYNLTEDKDEPANVSPTGARFRKGKLGVIPETLEFLVDKRGELKNLLKKADKGSPDYVKLSARSQALKILANSFYGYLGYARSRWYNRHCAESTTAWGRMHIQATITEAEKFGFKVLYGDTDSTFLLLGDKTEEDVLKFVEHINKSLPGKMELELEAFYTRGVFVSKKTTTRGVDKDEDVGAKKKYALLGKDGRIKIRGFELVRRDWSSVAKNTQRQVLEAILKEGSKEKAVKIVRDVIERLKSGKVPLEELAITTQMNKDPNNYDIVSPELSAAKKAVAKGVPLEQGSLIQYVVTKSGKTISEKAELLEFAKDYDPDYYINNQLLPAVMKILKELGYEEHDLKFGGKQQNLDAFFG